MKNNKRYVSAFCIGMSSVLGMSVVYGYTNFYVAFQNATQMTHTQIGLLVSILGIASTILYFPSGYLADKFNCPKLTWFGLFGTVAIAIGIACLPKFPLMCTLYIGFTIFAILIAWDAQIKLFRMLGTDEEQGKIMSIRAWGRCLPVILINFIGSYLLTKLPERTAMTATYLMYAAVILIGTIIAMITFKPVVEQPKSENFSMKDYGRALKNKDVWMIGLLGFTVYAGYTGTTYLMAYFNEIYGASSAATSVFATIGKQIGILSAPVLTWFGARKIKGMSVTKACGLGMIVAAILMLWYVIVPATNASLYVPSTVVFFIMCFFVIATWSLQFVPVGEIKLPMDISGSAVGVISAFSFVSDCFLMTIYGSLIDNKGLEGYKIIFICTVILFAICAYACLKLGKKIAAQSETTAA